MTILEDQINAIFELVEPYCNDLQPHHEQEIRDGILKILTPPSLEDYGLLVGQKIKFVPGGFVHRKDGHVLGINADGSVYVQDHAKNFGRSIMPQDLYIEIPGPRGGSSWQRLQGDEHD